MLDKFKGKYVRVRYTRDGREHGVTGMLTRVDGSDIVIGGIRIINLTDYTIEEVKEK